MTYSTVRAATVGELAYLRTPGQWSKLYLAIFKPSTVYTATLASVPASTDRVVEISFTGGTGTLANVLPDMTLYVGSAAGTYDLGVARIRKAPIAGTFYIGEESDINWSGAGTVYLTVVNEFDLWAKHINTINDTTFYMDYDIVYTDQNTNLSPVPIMGGHRVLKLTGANVSTQFDWSNSYCIGSSISSYSVSCSSATITNGTTSTPTLQFTAAGWHMVVLTVTAANGKSSVGVRYVYIYSDAVPPATVFQLESCTSDYQVGGWNFNVTMQSEIGLTDVPERTLCILFSEDYYGDTNVSMGQLAGCENIICVGKIAEESYDINPEQGEVTLQVHGMQYWLDKVYAFPTGVILTTSTPTNWAEMQSPTIDKVLFRLLHWGSTATKVMDIYLTNDTRIASELISPASNLWAQISEISFATIYASPGVDRYGRLFIETEPQIVPSASRTWPTIMEITKADWYDSVKLQRIFISPTGMVNSSGVSVDAAGNGTALFSLSAGHVFKHYGQPEVIDRLLLSTQALGNQFAGLVLGWKNNPFPNNEFTLSSYNKMIDCFPRQFVEWQMLSADNPRGFSFGLTKFVPRRIELRWDSRTGFMETGISLEMASVEQLSMNGDIPGDGDVDISQPPAPPNFPEFPTFPVLSGVDIPLGATTTVLLYSSSYGLLRTSNFNDAAPHWEAWNTGLGTIADGTPRKNLIHQTYITPSGAVYVIRLLTIPGAAWTYPDREFFIARAPNVGGSFSLLISRDQWDADHGSPPYFYSWGLIGFGINKTLSDSVMYATWGWGTGSGEPPARVFVGTGGSFSAGEVTSISNLGSGGGDMAGEAFSYGNGKWIYSKPGGFFEFNTTGHISGSFHSQPEIQISTFDRYMPGHIRGGTSARVYSPAASSHMLGSPDNFTTIYNIPDTGVNYPRYTGLAVDPTGLVMMVRGIVANTSLKSTDGGVTWSPITALPAGGWYFMNMGDANHWCAAAGTAVRWTEDGGSSWINKEGNITADFPITDIAYPAGYIG